LLWQGGSKKRVVAENAGNGSGVKKSLKDLPLSWPLAKDIKKLA